ncbi:nucleotide exchange factor GrpE [Rhodococcus sp. 1168]|uniref:nucleotide exchange factor GrpE n=1 Tax=Rhodococcus sp. 1168 TaxID=2018041 RepID=UPI000A0CAD63|nr:nucleotide exchange factor GrpE [Rhodococcus sp. 1168]ORI21159.1 nucleotide exchange factor GrpE [Rhodococcus sp. 1168]
MSADDQHTYADEPARPLDVAAGEPVGTDVPDEVAGDAPDGGAGTTDAVQTAADPAVQSGELADMVRALERFHSRAEQYESIIRRMQARIEELQADQIRELLKPVILKLASLHTEARGSEARAAARSDDLGQKDFDFFVSEIEETLGLLDIESIGVSVLDDFDAGKHAARRRVETDDASLDRRVERVLRQGFTYIGAERVFMPAMVTVYRYQGVEAVDSANRVSVAAANVSAPANHQNEGENRRVL